MAQPEMPIESHLKELRTRLFWLIALYLPVAAIFFTHVTWLIGILLMPAHGRITHLVYLSVTEAFFAYIKVSLAAAFVVISPFLLYQLARFVLPGLHDSERQVVTRYVPVVVFLFLLGLSFGFFVFLPLVIRFLFAFTGPELVPMISLGQYINFVIGLTLPFGLIFEFPVIVYGLTRAGVVQPAWLRRNRRYAILVIFVIAAAFAPPDALSMLVMASPMLLLYEVGLWLAEIAIRRRDRETRR